LWRSWSLQRWKLFKFSSECMHAVGLWISDRSYYLPGADGIIQK
jgi:hypothetical protein